MTRLLDESAKGVYIIAATPFADNGALDLDSTDRMTDYYLRVGCDGMTILGVMGEAPKLSPEESVQFAERVLARVAGRIPVIVGVSAPGLTVMKSLTDKVMQLGAAGVMVAPNAGLKTDEAIEAFLRDFYGTARQDDPLKPLEQAAGWCSRRSLLERRLGHWLGRAGQRHRDRRRRCRSRH